jgi:hypothetical protein
MDPATQIAQLQQQLAALQAQQNAQQNAVTAPTAGQNAVTNGATAAGPIGQNFVNSGPQQVALPPQQMANPPVQVPVSHQNGVGLAVVGARVAPAKSMEDENKDMLILIRKEVKHKIWRRLKFVTTEQRGRFLATCVRDSLQLLEHMGPSQEAKNKREEWLEKWHKATVSALNSHRNYVINRIRKACFRKYLLQDKDIPPDDVIDSILKRDFSVTLSTDTDSENSDENAQQEDQKVMAMRDFWLFWWDTLCSVAAGVAEHWGPEKRYYMTLSDGAPPDAPEDKYITPSTEAFLAIIIKSFRSRWIHTVKALKENPDFTKVEFPFKDDDGNEFTGAYKVRLDPNFWSIRPRFVEHLDSCCFLFAHVSCQPPDCGG